MNLFSCSALLCLIYIIIYISFFYGWRGSRVSVLGTITHSFCSCDMAVIMLYCISDCSAVGEERRGMRLRGGNPQSDFPHRRLEALGKDNRKALWYILSRSLSHAIVFHFGEGVYARENISLKEDESDDNEESCSGDMADEEIEEKRNAGQSNVCVYAFVIVGITALFFNLMLPSDNFLRRFV